MAPLTRRSVMALLLMLLLASSIQLGSSISAEEEQFLIDVMDLWSPIGWSQTMDPCASVEGIVCTGINLELTGLTFSQQKLDNIAYAIPESIENLKNLTRLTLRNMTDLASLPSTIGNLPKLTELYLDDIPKLTSLPSTIGNLANLTDLRMNKLYTLNQLPSSMNQLTKLVTLQMDFLSSILSIPDISSLTNLRDLTISYLDNLRTPPKLNQLVNLLTLNMIYLPSLTESPNVNGLINMENLRLVAIPSLKSISGLENMPNITRLTLTDNALRVCPTQFNISEATKIAFCSIVRQTVDSFCNCSSQWTGCSSSPGYFTSKSCNPTGCDSNPPSPSFVCQDGVWVLLSSYSSPNIQVQGPTQIEGNLTISQILTFSGLSGTLAVNGCISINGSVVVELSDSDLSELTGQGGRKSTTLIQSLSQDKCGIIDIDIGRVSVKQPKSCKKVTLSKDTSSTDENFSVLFKVDSSKCNLWWIVLASVVGFVVLTLVILMILFTFVPCLKSKARPFWLRSKKTSSTTNKSSIRDVGRSAPCECCKDGVHRP